MLLLNQPSRMRAALFNFNPPPTFTTSYLHHRMFKIKPNAFAESVESTREFWVHVMESKIEATIGSEGDQIGWEDDEEIVGPIAFAAKRSFLRALPYIMPHEDAEADNANSLYRLILEPGDFGIHNTSITRDANGKPLVTSLYDWKTGCIVPALLSDTLVAVGPVDLIMDENAKPPVTRIPEQATKADLKVYAAWAQHYIQVCSQVL
jgi:hypothetical protein